MTLLRPGSNYTKLPYLLKTACTDVLVVIVTLQVGEVPEQAPVQFTNCLPSGGMAVSVTVVPEVNFAEQLLPQSRARSLPVGVPMTVPGLLRPTERVNCGLNVALTLVAPLTVTEQFNSVPVHAPCQPIKTRPPGLAVSEIVAPLSANSAQPLPHLILPSEELTVPPPLCATISTSGLIFTAEF